MNKDIRQDKIVGSRRFSNYFWTFVLFIGGISFLLAGLSSYLKINLLPFTNTSELVFIPQGVVMMFYGTLSLSISIYTLLTVVWEIEQSAKALIRLVDQTRMKNNVFS